MDKKIFVFLILLLLVSFSTQAFASLTFTSNAITGTTSSTIDLGTGNTLSLQTTTNAPITIGTGLVTLGGSLNVTTSVTTPLIIGGSAVSSSIIYKSTIGSGTATGIAHQFVSGANGGTKAMSIFNNGKVSIGSTDPATFSNSKMYIRNADTTNFSSDDSRYAMVVESNFSTGDPSSNGLYVLASNGIDGGGTQGIYSNVKTTSNSSSVYANVASVSAIGTSSGVNLFGYTSSADMSIHAVVDNNYGFYVYNPWGIGAGNSLVNNYGLYIENQTKGTNNFAIYSAGGTNYFGGNVGISTTAPTQKLEVNGGVRLNTATAKPACSATTRGTFWTVQGGAGVADTVETCIKNAADAYTWQTLY